MTLTPAQLQAAVVSAQEAVAAEDLATLTTFAALEASGSTTLGQIESALAGLQTSLVSPTNQQAMSAATGLYAAFASCITNLITSNTVTANATSNTGTAQDTLVAALAAQATSDLAVLNTFSAVLANSSTTNTQLSSAYETMITGLSAPATISAVESAAANSVAFWTSVKTQVSINNHLAGN